jgi:2-keto-4-pentenoate hydratase
MTSASLETRSDIVREAAASIYNAVRDGEVISPLREVYPDGDVDLAYAIQDANTKRWIGEGRRLTGRKIGLTSKAVQEQLGVGEPDFGMLFADMAFASGEEIPWHRLHQPRCEAEVALVLERDLPTDRVTLPDLIRATAYALPAIEVVGSRIAKWNIRFFDTVADNASSGVYVLGNIPVKLEALDLELTGMVMEQRGKAVSLGCGAACLGHPYVAAVWLARKMAEVGRPLVAGDTILTGALGPMIAAEAGDVFEARIGGLGGVRAVFGPLAKAAAGKRAR